MEVRIEDAEWNPYKYGRAQSKSVAFLRSLKPGDVKRIYHPDLQCNKTDGTCSLTQAITRLRKEGWKIKAYHEAPHILIVAIEEEVL